MFKTSTTTDKKEIIREANDTLRERLNQYFEENHTQIVQQIMEEWQCSAQEAEKYIPQLKMQTHADAIQELQKRFRALESHHRQGATHPPTAGVS